jgi:hypothetical protein
LPPQKTGMAMANQREQETQHALLVAWGKVAQEIGLISGIEAVKLGQKNYAHTPQAKVIEFFVAILSGAKYLQDISLAAHPLDKDPAVAQSWGQTSWADYSGVSRTMSKLSWEEARALVAVMERISKPWIESELKLIQGLGKIVEQDGDLTGIPVSNTSWTYPNTAYGHMDDEIRLGYQAGVTSFHSPTYGRLWLSVDHHAGDTVSCTQAEALALAAEARTGLRPRRRTELLQGRIEAFQKERQPTETRLERQKVALEKAHSAKQETLDQLQAAQLAPKTKPERIQSLEQRVLRRDQAITVAQKRFEKTLRLLQASMEQEKIMCARLRRFEQENADNSNPGPIRFRLDAGFGTYDNMALLIEMGYELYTKLHNHKVTQALLKLVQPQDTWSRVGKNAEMVAWPALKLEHCPYPLSLGLERFHTGDKKLKHSTLAYFGTAPVTDDLPAWFGKYNGRQSIEAGIKETKQVFYLHRLKVRSEPAIYLQEAMTIFAANFIRFAAVWIDQHSQPDHNQLEIRKMGIKRQVQVAAHASAKVILNSDGMLLMFSPASSLAGKSLWFRAAEKPVRPNCFSPLFTFLVMIAQRLR